MSEKLLQQALLEVCNKEFAPFEDGEEHLFSRKHNRKMKAMFAEYSGKSRKRIPLKQRIIIAVCVILLAVITGMTAVAIANKFGIFAIFQDHTEVVTTDRTDVPESIGKIYCIPNPPDGYNLYEYIYDYDYVSVTYYDDSFKHVLSFQQLLKDNYLAYVDTEGYDIVFTDVGEYEGYYVDYFDDNYGEASLLVWDNGDYVFELLGHFTVDEFMEMAKTICVDPNAEFGYWCIDG